MQSKSVADPVLNSLGLYVLYGTDDGQVVVIKVFALADEWKNRLSSFLHFPSEILCHDYMPALVNWLALDPVVLYIPISSNIVKKQSPQFVYCLKSSSFPSVLQSAAVAILWDKSTKSLDWLLSFHDTICSIFSSKVPVSTVYFLFWTITTVSISQVWYYGLQQDWYAPVIFHRYETNHT